MSIVCHYAAHYVYLGGEDCLKNYRMVWEEQANRWTAFPFLRETAMTEFYAGVLFPLSHSWENKAEQLLSEWKRLQTEYPKLPFPLLLKNSKADPFDISHPTLFCLKLDLQTLLLTTSSRIQRIV